VNGGRGDGGEQWQEEIHTDNKVAREADLCTHCMYVLSVRGYMIYVFAYAYMCAARRY
jgi:hypothetical protein